MDDLETLPGIGPGVAAELRAVGVRDVATLRELGSATAAERLAELGMRTASRARSLLDEALGEVPPARPPLAVDGLGSVELRVGDLAAALEHYVERAGLMVRSRRATDAALEAGGGATLLLTEVADGAGGARVWLTVPDVRAAAERMRAADLSPIDTQSQGGRCVELADPWGNVVGFVGPPR